MSFKSKLLMAMMIMALIADYSLAAWLELQSIPVPPNTEQVEKEERRIAGQVFDFTYYLSTQDPSQIKDFYRKELPRLGWKEKEPLKDLQQIPNFQVEPGLSNVFEQNLMFEKDDLTLIINFVPQGAFKDAKTRFSLSQGKIDLKAEPSEEKDFIPELLTKPKKDVAPTYPDAALIYLSEPAHGLRATYFTKDDINTVTEFYKSKMPNYGWFLVEEKALEKIELPEVSKDDIAKLCPTCAENVGISPQGIETWMGQLSFSNPRGDTCRLGFSYILDSTTITVDYAEKR